MLRKIKELLCRHDYRLYTINRGVWHLLGRDKVCRVCSKCGKVKKNSYQVVENKN